MYNFEASREVVCPNAYLRSYIVVHGDVHRQTQAQGIRIHQEQ